MIKKRGITYFSYLGQTHNINFLATMLVKVLKRIVITSKSTQTNKQKELLVWGGAHRILAVCLRPCVQFPIMKKKKDQQVQLFLKKIINMSVYACVSGWNWSSGIVDVAQDGFEL